MSRFYKAIKSIPLVGPVIVIVNSWVSDGSYESQIRFASAAKTFSRLWSGVFFSLLICGIQYLISADVDSYTLGVSKVPDVNLSVFPNILGVGLAVFLILFSMNQAAITSLRTTLLKQDKDPALLAAELAYPMAIVALTIFISFIAKIYLDGLPLDCLSISRPLLGALTQFLFVYTFVCIADALLSVYMIASKALR